MLGGGPASARRPAPPTFSFLLNVANVSSDNERAPENFSLGAHSLRPGRNEKKQLTKNGWNAAQKAAAKSLGLFLPVNSPLQRRRPSVRRSLHLAVLPSLLVIVQSSAARKRQKESEAKKEEESCPPERIDAKQAETLCGNRSTFSPGENANPTTASDSSPSLPGAFCIWREPRASQSIPPGTDDAHLNRRIDAPEQDECRTCTPPPNGHPPRPSVPTGSPAPTIGSSPGRSRR